MNTYYRMVSTPKFIHLPALPSHGKERRDKYKILTINRIIHDFVIIKKQTEKKTVLKFENFPAKIWQSANKGWFENNYTVIILITMFIINWWNIIKQFCKKNP